MPQHGITLDGPSTKDIDDAFDLSINGNGDYFLSIMIAHVAGTVHIGSDIDQRAYDMTATRYFAQGNSPMLPRKFSEKKLSLWPDGPKDVVRINLVFNPTTFQQLVFNIECSADLKFQSLAKLKYDDVPSILADEKHQFHRLFKEASKLAFGLLERRRKEGAMALYDLNNGWITTEEGHLKKLEKHEETIGQIIIQEFMIAANRGVAEWCVKRNIPALYRNHGAKAAAPLQTDLVQQMQDAILHPIQNLDTVRQRVHMLMDRAEYGPTLKGHYGLNLPAYLHFTSPIRRYADLVNHRQILGHIQKPEVTPYTQEQLQEIADHINSVTVTERDERSARMKERHETFAQTVSTDVRRLDGLGAKEFERVIKVQARSGEDPTEALMQAFALRLKDNRVPPICQTFAYVASPVNEAWKPLREMLLQHFSKMPQDAITVTTQATQVCGWPLIQYGSTQTGPSHEPRFDATAVIDFTGVENTPPGETKAEAVGGTAKEAKFHVCVELLAGLYGLEPPEVVSLKKEAPKPASKKKAAEFVFDQSKDPISVLHEYCQAQGVPFPSYDFELTGLQHLPTVVCVCQFQDIKVKVSSASKQEAKREAVKKILASLNNG